MNLPLPLSVANNRRLDRWVRFDPGRRVHLAVGKVEIGQGVLTALSQIAAEELDVGLARIEILAGDTDAAPDEGSTSSSQSIEMSGASVRLIMAEVRGRVLARLAQRLNCSPDDLTIEDGEFLRDDLPTGFDYWNFASDEDLAHEAEGNATPKPPAGYRIVGQSVPRVDLPAKLTGAAFIHDIVRPDLLHARVLRQPGRNARLTALDENGLRRAAPGEYRIVRIENFIAFAGADETAVQRAASVAPAHATWAGARGFTAAQAEAGWLVGRADAIERIVGEPPAPPAEGDVVEATYTRPYVAHAAIAPSCALAEFRDGHLTVWSHTQGVYPLRAALADVMGLDKTAITVRHAHGAGCYGHNGADDAALDAALIARELPDHCIRVQWMREEEFAYEPFSTAQSVRLRVAVDDEGKPSDWTADIWSGPHVGRTTFGGTMLAADALPGQKPPSRPNDPPETAGGGGTRNAVPLYDIPAKRILHHLVTDCPVRTSSLRALGALPNVFAMEQMIDKLALRAGQDPVAYRLSILTEKRARRVIEDVARLSGWTALGPSGSGRGRGMAFARYKNRAAYAAVVVDLEVDQEVRLLRVWCVADAGLVINPDGARNQVEGGILHAASMTLKEQVRLGPGGIETLDWDSYPILRFSEVPEVTVQLIHAPDLPSLGMGECSFGPTAAAIGNAVAHALGTRIRDMPLSRERIMAALLA
jgi:CO/xanthine dehydrogenase Mo-binding subunit